MINVNSFESRIVNFIRIDSEGNESVKPAEIRRLEITSGDVPSSVTVRLTDPLNFMITFAYDSSVKKFRGPLGTDTWESDFNIEDFIQSSKTGTDDRYIKRKRY